MTEFTLLMIFLVIGAIGFLFLMISLLVGDLFEAFDFDLDFDADFDGADGGFGMLDTRVISVFLTTFGGIGAIAVQLGYNAIIASLSGLIGGVILGAAVYFFGKILYGQQSNSSVGAAQLVGKTAQVIVPILTDSIGQISIRVGEERVEKIARTRDGSEIKAGQDVFIESVSGDGVIVSIDDGRGHSLFSEKS